MDKPISITVEEAKKTIAEAVNSVNLSPTILEWILKDILQEVQDLHLIEYRTDMERYNDNKDKTE